MMLDYAGWEISLTAIRVTVPTVAFGFYVYYVWIKDYD